MSSSAVQFARKNHPRFLDELKDLLRIPSISTLPEHNGDCRRAAEALSAELTRIGMENVRIIETEGHPLVYADWLHAVSKPTALVYGHYDVQPADPLDEWLSPPFEPAERNGNLYARGAVDDKGQVWAQVKALESLLAANKALPLNVRVIFEGEEEVGGEGIAQYVASKPPELKADFALVSDTELFAPGLPTLCVGLRGMMYRRFDRGQDTRNVLIVGTGPEAHALRHHVESIRHLGYTFKGFIEFPGTSSRITSSTGDVVGTLDTLFQLARKQFVDEIFFTTQCERGIVQDVLDKARRNGVDLRVVPDLYDGLAWNSPIEYIGQFPTIPLHRGHGSGVISPKFLLACPASLYSHHRRSPSRLSSSNHVGCYHDE